MANVPIYEEDGVTLLYEEDGVTPLYEEDGTPGTGIACLWWKVPGG